MRSVFESPAFTALSPHACKLLLELVGQYRGDNNGDLTLAWSLMKARGWRSRSTLWRCKTELIEAGFVYETRKGRLPSTCSLLALTWFALDVSRKFDPEALACFKPKRDWTLPNGGITAQSLVPAETMNYATSPRLKHWKPLNPPYGFTGGLVGPYCSAFNVSQVDTFIEEPFCTLDLKSTKDQHGNG